MKSVDYIELDALAIIYSCTIGQVHLLVICMADSLEQSFYVDDLITGAEDVESAS